MKKKTLIVALQALAILLVEITLGVGLFLLLVCLTFGMMAGCSTIQEFIHIFF